MSKYTDSLLDLLPNGLAWNKFKNSNLYKLMSALAEEFQRVENRSIDLLNESDPRTCSETLEDWERIAALPDGCVDGDRTSVERRAQLLQKITSRGGQSRQFFIDLIKELGFEAEIIEHRPFQVGKSTVGDSLTNTDEWIFTWTVRLLDQVVYHFQVGKSSVGEPLAVFRNDTVECVINRMKPAHTRVLFSFVTGE